MKAKVLRLDEIPERFWTESSDYWNSETCNSYHDYIEIDPHVFQGFEKADNRVCVSNPRTESDYVKGREMFCFSLGDYLYLIKARRDEAFSSSILWRIKWNKIEISDVEDGVTKITITEES